jgi:hypothetical protein
MDVRQEHACNCPLKCTQEEMESRMRNIHSQSMFDLLQQGATSVMSGGHDQEERLPIEAACNLNIGFIILELQIQLNNVNNI